MLVRGIIVHEETIIFTVFLINLINRYFNKVVDRPGEPVRATGTAYGDTVTVREMIGDDV